MRIRDRVRELRRVRAKDRILNPKRWRTHPEAQRDTLQGILSSIGYADALLARETPDGLQLVDGRLRAEAALMATYAGLAVWGWISWRPGRKR